jgi:hypothetical protein
MIPFKIDSHVQCVKNYVIEGIVLLTVGTMYKVLDINYYNQYQGYAVIVEADNGLTYAFKFEHFTAIDTIVEDNVIHGAFLLSELDPVQFENNLKQLIEFGENAFGIIHVVHLLKPLLKKLESERNEKYTGLFSLRK